MSSLLGSSRFNLTLYCASGIILTMCLKFNFSMALVCMVGANESQEDTNITREFDWTRQQQGSLIASNYYAYIPAQILGGGIAHKFGSKKTIVFSMILLGILGILTPLTARSSYWLLFASRFVQGVFGGTITPLFNTIPGRWAGPNEQATLMAIVTAAVPISTTSTPPIASLLCNSGIDGGWPMIFYVSGATILVWTILFQIFTSENPNSHKRMTKEERKYLNSNMEDFNDTKKKLNVPWRPIFTSFAVFVVVFTQFCNTWIFALISVNLPFFIDEVFKVGIVENGLLCAIPHFLQLIISLNGRMVDLIQKKEYFSATNLRKIFTAFGMIGAGSVLGLLPSVSSFQWAQIICLGLSIAIRQFVIIGGVYTSHQDMSGQFSSITYGLGCAMGSVATLITPNLISFIVTNGTQAEWNVIFYLAAGVSIFGGICYSMFGASKRQIWADMDVLN